MANHNALLFTYIILCDALNDFVEDINDSIQVSDGMMAVIKNPQLQDNMMLVS